MSLNKWMTGMTYNRRMYMFTIGPLLGISRFSPVFAAKSRPSPLRFDVRVIQWSAQPLQWETPSAHLGPTVKVRDGQIPNILMVQKSGNHQLRLVVYPIIYKAFTTIPGGWEWDFWLPSTVWLLIGFCKCRTIWIDWLWYRKESISRRMKDSETSLKHPDLKEKNVSVPSWSSLHVRDPQTMT